MALGLVVGDDDPFIIHTLTASSERKEKVGWWKFRNRNVMGDDDGDGGNGDGNDRMHPVQATKYIHYGVHYACGGNG